ncbi:hypothetical protein U1Q18_000643 [Sarracenia purpurea var. burkii]
MKSFRNTNSQISASVTANGKYVVCASEDSHVYVWKHEADSRPSRSKGITVTRSYEHFYCQDVSVAVPWPGMCDLWGFHDTLNQLGDHSEEVSTANHPPTPVEEINGNENSPIASGCSNSPLHGTISSATNGYFFDRISATWPEEKLLLVATKNQSPRVSVDFTNGAYQNRSAWGMVIVTAGLRGKSGLFKILDCRFGFKGQKKFKMRLPLARGEIYSISLSWQKKKNVQRFGESSILVIVFGNKLLQLNWILSALCYFDIIFIFKLNIK